MQLIHKCTNTNIYTYIQTNKTKLVKDGPSEGENQQGEREEETKGTAFYIIITTIIIICNYI